ncbi:D-beta-hydroxybutyrate dehydrogenase [Stackebrandtia soli]
MGEGMELSGRRALVTGAAGGIGESVARRLAAAGVRVLCVDIDGPGAHRVARDIGGEARSVDLSDMDAVDRVSLSDIDILVNNAGMQHVAPIHEFPPDTFALLLRIMVEAPFRLIRGVLPHMYERGFGRIVNVSSVHGLRASAFKSAYVTAKHALEGLSKVTALEGAPYGVTSNCVNPGYVRTPLVEKQIVAQAEHHGLTPDEVVRNVMLGPEAIKRLIEPEEVAEFVAFLCGPNASFMTGGSHVIDGGWTAH